MLFLCSTSMLFPIDVRNYLIFITAAKNFPSSTQSHKGFKSPAAAQGHIFHAFCEAFIHLCMLVMHKQGATILAHRTSIIT